MYDSPSSSGSFPPPQLYQTPQLITLPKDIIYKILSELKPSDLAQICKSHTQLAKIGNDSNFWKLKHLQSFKTLPRKSDPKMKYYYRLLHINDDKIHQLENDLIKKLFEIIRVVTDDKYIFNEYSLDNQISRNFSPTFMEFERRMLKKLNSRYINSVINPNAEIFKQYPIDQFRSPLSALLKALFDIKLENQREIKRLQYEIEDLGPLRMYC